MNYKKIILNKELTELEENSILEIDEGHRYIMSNRYTDGFEDIQFLKIMTYKEMVEKNLPIDFINAQVPEVERNCDNCKYYIVQEGVYTQDVAEVLKKRLTYQYKWLKNGFYKNAKYCAECIIDNFAKFQEFRIVFGFYHKPYSNNDFLEKISIMDENILLQKKELVNTFFENEIDWNDKFELIKILNNIIK